MCKLVPAERENAKEGREIIKYDEHKL